jgi:hypothetical protein
MTASILDATGSPDDLITIKVTYSSVYLPFNYLLQGATYFSTFGLSSLVPGSTDPTGMHSAISFDDTKNEHSYLFQGEPSDWRVGASVLAPLTSPYYLIMQRLDTIDLPSFLPLPSTTIVLGTIKRSDLPQAMSIINNIDRQIQTGAIKYNPYWQNCNTLTNTVFQGLANSFNLDYSSLPTPPGLWTPGTLNTLGQDPTTFNLSTMVDQYFLQTNWYLPTALAQAILLAPVFGLNYLIRDVYRFVTGSVIHAKDPLLISLNDSPFSLSSLDTSNTYVDYTNSGYATKTSWMNAGTGMLVLLDPNGVPVALGASSGSAFLDLAGLDSNGDGLIDCKDSSFDNLEVWQDANDNGTIDVGELKSLSECGIVSISIGYLQEANYISGGEITGVSTVTMADGSSEDIQEVNLQTSPYDTKWTGTVSLTPEIAEMMQLNGAGNVKDLHSQMALDPVLVTLVETLSTAIASASAYDTLRALTESVMFRWAGVDQTPIESRGGIIDARRLDFVEKFLGTDLTFTEGNYGDVSNPGWVPALELNLAFVSLENSVLARSLVQNSQLFVGQYVYEATADSIVPLTNMCIFLLSEYGGIGPLSASTLDQWKSVATVIDTERVEAGINSKDAVGFEIALGVSQLDEVVNAISQGLALRYDGTTLHISNMVYDGLLSQEYAMFAGINYCYDVGDGAVSIDFAESANLEINQGPGGVPNTLLLGGNPGDFTVAVQANGDEVFADGVTGDILTITGELMSDGDVQRGIQDITFADGTVWTRAHAIAYADGTELTSPFAGVTYDTAGFTGSIAASGGGNTIIFGAGYGHITASETGHGGTIQLAAGIDPADVTFFVDAGTKTLTLSIDGGADTLTILNDDLSYQNQPSFDTVTFGDGTMSSLGDSRTVPLVYVVGPTQNVFTTANGYTQVDYDLGDGNALVYPYAPSVGARGEIVMGEDIAPSDVYLQSDDSSDLFIRFRGDATDSIQIYRDLYAYGPGTGSKVGDIRFADGTTLQLGVSPDLTSNTPLTFEYYGDGPGYLVGTLGGSNIFHLAPGGQTVIATNGFSQYDYDLGDGAAVLYARAPWYSGSGVISFGAGITAASAYLTTDLYNNFFIRFRGDDTDSVQIVNELYGNGIGDSGFVSKMLFADGTSEQIGVAPDQSSSNPFTFEYYATPTSTTLAGNSLGTNIYHLAAGSDLVITTVGYGLIDYALGDGAAQVNTTAPGYGASADVSLAAGITPDMVYLQVDNYSDLVVRFRGDDTDSIYLRNDIYNTAAGTVSSVSHLLFADGTSLLLGVLPDGSASNPLTYDWYAEASTTVLTGDRSGSNVFHLAPGGDTVVTTTGYSATIYSRGDGNATIRPTWTDGSSGDIALGAGITAADLYFQVQNYHDLVIRFHGDDADSITVQNGVYGTAAGTITAESNLIFSDGTSMTLGMSADGTTYSPMTYDWYGSEDGSAVALTGDPTGSNVFHLAPGGDAVTTTTGYSRVIYSLGDGNATIRPTAAGDGGSADLVFGPGITAADVYFQNENYDDLVIRFHGDDTDSITVTGDLYDAYAGTVSKLPDLVFSDGTSQQIGLSPDGTTYNPVKFDWYADASTTVLSGGTHGSSEFHLAAGGDDTVYTTATYSQIDFNAGDGNAIVHPTGPGVGGSADISLGAGLTEADLILTPDDTTDNLVISFRGDDTDSLTLQNDIYGGGTGGMVSYLKFNDGSQLRIGIAGTDTFVGDATHTVLQGSDDHNNVFDLGAGSDSVTAGVAGTDAESAIAQYITPLGTGSPDTFFMLPPEVNNVFNFGRGDGNADVDMKLGFGVLNLQGLNLTDVTVFGTARDLTVGIIGDSADSIHIHSSEPVGGFGFLGTQIAGNLDSIAFANGQTATVASLLQQAA